MPISSIDFHGGVVSDMTASFLGRESRRLGALRAVFGWPEENRVVTMFMVLDGWLDGRMDKRNDRRGLLQRGEEVLKTVQPILNQILFIFLDASSHLYKRVCPLVRRSVRRSVGPSVGRSVTRFFSIAIFEHYCPCPTVRN